jgi:hypothetical protein
MGEVSWKGQIPLPGHGNTPWQIEQMPHGKSASGDSSGGIYMESVSSAEDNGGSVP